jgi:hypothetical protein
VPIQPTGTVRTFNPAATKVQGLGLTKGIASLTLSGSFTIQTLDTNGVPWWPAAATRRRLTQTTTSVRFTVDIVSTTGSTRVTPTIANDGRGTYTVTYSETVATTFRVTVTQSHINEGSTTPIVTTVRAGATAALMTLRPGVTSSLHSTLDALLASPQTGIPFTVSLVARDQFDNLQVYGVDYPVSLDNFVLVIEGTQSLPDVGFAYNTTNNKWDATSTILVTGNFDITTTLNGVTVTDIAGNTAILTPLVESSPLTASQSLLLGDDGLTDGSVGTRTFTIVARDVVGNPIAYIADVARVTCVVTLTGVTDSTIGTVVAGTCGSDSSCLVNDGTTCTFPVTYEVRTAGGYRLDVSLCAPGAAAGTLCPVQGSPVTITKTALTTPSAVHTTPNPVPSVNSLIQAGVPWEVLVVTRDVFENVMAAPDASIEVTAYQAGADPTAPTAFGSVTYQVGVLPCLVGLALSWYVGFLPLKFLSLLFRAKRVLPPRRPAGGSSLAFLSTKLLTARTSSLSQS